MKNNLRELLDKIYELEGLVHLALKREEASADFLHLIAKKGEEVSSQCSIITTIENNNDSLSNKILDRADINSPSQDPEEYSLEEDKNSHEYALEEENEDPDSYESNVVTNNKQAKGKLVFSINERFRFKRELFSNSDAEFNNTLAIVASMEDYEEAEGYFLNEVGFRRSNPVVSEFLEIIKRYFS